MQTIRSVVTSGKAMHERHPGEALLLDLSSNCEWAWQTKWQKACFFTTPGGCPVAVLPGLLSMFGLTLAVPARANRPPTVGAPVAGPPLGAGHPGPTPLVHGNEGFPSQGPLICRSEHTCLCGPILVSSAGDAGCSDSGFTDPECWLILRSHKGCRLLWIAGRWP